MKQLMDQKELRECIGGPQTVNYADTVLQLIEGLDPKSINFFAAHPGLANILNNIAITPVALPSS